MLLGQGMRVLKDGRTMLIGSRELLRRQGVPVCRRAADWVRRLQRATETPLLLAVEVVLEVQPLSAAVAPSASAPAAHA